MNRPEGSKRNLRSNSSVRRTSAAAGTPASTRPTRSRIAETSRRPTQSQTTPTDTHRVLRQHSQPSWEPLQQDWRDRMHQHDQQPMYSASPTAEQQDDIHRLFQSLDHKGRGVISSHKLRVAMAEMGLDAPTAEELNEWVAEVDPKDTGRINYEQFEEFMARRLDEADQQDQMMNAFRLFKPGSGREGITFEDLKQIASHLGESIPDEELHEMINIADTQDTGQVSFEDFSRIMLKTGLF